MLDTGCANTVAGARWYSDYCDSLTAYDRSRIVEKESSRAFTFGDGKTYKSIKRATIPCSIGDIKATIDLDVVTCEIPLLLSKDAMKRAEMVIDMKFDSLKVKSKTIKLMETSSGHYKLPLRQ